MIKKSSRAYFYAFSAVLLWSTAATAFKITLRHISPLEMLFAASVSSCFFMGMVTLVRRRMKEVFTLGSIRSSAFSATLNPLLYYLVLFKGYDLLNAQNALVLNYSWPIVLSLLSVPFLKQKLALRTLFALFMGLAGVSVVVGGVYLGEGFDPALLLPLSSSVLWGIYWMVNIRDKRDDSVKLFLNFLIGSLFSGLLLLFTEGFSGFNMKGILGSVYIGAFEMGFTFYIWLKALKSADRTSRVSSVIFLAPFVSLVFIALVLGEAIKVTTFAGLFMIIIGILLESGAGRKKDEDVNVEI